MILYLGNNLKSKGVTQTTMVTLSELLKMEGYTIVLSSSKQNKVFRLLSMFWAILKHLKEIDYILIDAYSTQNFYYAYFTSSLCKLLNLRYIPILHGGNLPDRLDKSPRLSKKLFQNSYKTVAPSRYLKTEFEKKGYTAEYIPNVIEIEKYKYEERGISVPKLLYVRAFATIYNPEMAIEVLKEVKEIYPKAKLCMIGPEKDTSFNSCKTLVKELNLEDSIEFTGKMSKSDWHKKAQDYNIFINTTNVDNTPVSVMEAMALGLPVITTNVGGIPYLIDDRNTGVLVDKGDVGQMVNAIRELFDNQELAKSIARNARKQVEMFDWKQVREQWHKILQ